MFAINELMLPVSSAIKQSEWNMRKKFSLTYIIYIELYIVKIVIYICNKQLRKT